MIEVKQPINIVRIAPRRCDVSTRVDFGKVMRTANIQQSGDTAIKLHLDQMDSGVEIKPTTLLTRLHELFTQEIADAVRAELYAKIIHKAAESAKTELTPVGVKHTVFTRNP